MKIKYTGFTEPEKTCTHKLIDVNEGQVVQFLSSDAKTQITRSEFEEAAKPNGYIQGMVVHQDPIQRFTWVYCFYNDGINGSLQHFSNNLRVVVVEIEDVIAVFNHPTFKG